MKTRLVAFQGEHGAFSEQAAQHFFGGKTVTVPCRNFEDVFAAVTHRRATDGIVPIENSLYGSVHQNYDLLQKYDLGIAGEINLRIVHALLVNRGTAFRDIRFIFSHPQALGQCEKFLKRLKNVEIVAAYDTAGAARMVQHGHRRDGAAIASVEAAKLYGLKILRKGLETDYRNYTRFLILSRAMANVRKYAKTSIIFSMKNVPGALFKALSVFALREINLYKIESRPIIGKPWEYLFYLDFKGSVDDEPSRNALRHLQEIASYVKILGSYRQGKTIEGRSA